MEGIKKELHLQEKNNCDMFVCEVKGKLRGSCEIVSSKGTDNGLRKEVTIRGRKEIDKQRN